MDDVRYCDDHRRGVGVRYAGHRRPRGDCPLCLQIYFSRQEIKAWEKKIARLRSPRRDT